MLSSSPCRVSTSCGSRSGKCSVHTMHECIGRRNYVWDSAFPSDFGEHSCCIGARRQIWEHIHLGTKNSALPLQRSTFLHNGKKNGNILYFSKNYTNRLSKTIKTLQKESPQIIFVLQRVLLMETGEVQDIA